MPPSRFGLHAGPASRGNAEPAHGQRCRQARTFITRVEVIATAASRPTIAKT